LDCCYLEVLHDEVVQDAAPGAQLTINEATIRQYKAAISKATEPLVLAQLADQGLAQLGVDQRLTAGNDYAISMEWSEAIHEDHPIVDGIIYASRHDNLSYSVALFERSKHKMAWTEIGRLRDPRIPDLSAEIKRILDKYGVQLIPDFPIT